MNVCSEYRLHCWILCDKSHIFPFGGLKDITVSSDKQVSSVELKNPAYLMKHAILNKFKHSIGIETQLATSDDRQTTQ